MVPLPSPTHLLADLGVHVFQPLALVRLQAPLKLRQWHRRPRQRCRRRRLVLRRMVHAVMYARPPLGVRRCAPCLGPPRGRDGCSGAPAPVAPQAAPLGSLLLLLLLAPGVFVKICIRNHLQGGAGRG